MERPLKGHTAVITGGATGPGLAIARALAKAGADIVLVDDHGAVGDAASRITAELGIPAMGARGALDDEAFIATAFRAAIEHLDFPDALIVAAPTGSAAALQAFDERLVIAGKHGTGIVLGQPPAVETRQAFIHAVDPQDEDLAGTVLALLTGQ